MVNSSSDNLEIAIKKNKHNVQPTVKEAPHLILNAANMKMAKFQVYIGINAWWLLWKHAISVRDREVGGVLIGEFCKENTCSSHYLDISAIIKAEHANEEQASLTFTHQTWNKLHEQVDENYPNKDIVGWYHTHPGFGVKLSSKDKFIHDNFFNLPYQMALVLDPINMNYLYYLSNKGKYGSSNKIFVYINGNCRKDISRLAKMSYPQELDKFENYVTRMRNRYMQKNYQDYRFAICFNDSESKNLTEELLLTVPD